MAYLSAFFDDNKPLAVAVIAAALLVIIIVSYLLYRLTFGRRLRAASGGRARQPRLGIVDAFDLDRQRQLVLVRRDNVEHLIMIGGPNDIVIESAIVRAQQPVSVATGREKDLPVLGTSGAVPPQIPVPANAAPAFPGLAPPIQPPAVPVPAPQAAKPVASPPVAANPPERPSPRPAPAAPAPTAPVSPAAPAVAAATPAAAVAPASSAPAGQETPAAAPLRPTPAPPPRPTAVQPPARPQPGAVAGTTPGQTAPRPVLPPRPPSTRPTIGSTLPPRPPRAPLSATPQAPAASPPQDNGANKGGTLLPALTPEPAVPANGEEALRAILPAATVVPPVTGGTAATPPRAAPAVPKSLDTLESLEEEMAKLLGRPAPRRDG